jgi:hypothetical protein
VFVSKAGVSLLKNGATALINSVDKDGKTSKPLLLVNQSETAIKPQSHLLSEMADILKANPEIWRDLLTQVWAPLYNQIRY